MAVIDKEGKWKAFATGKELLNVMNVFRHSVNQVKAASIRQIWSLSRIFP